MCPREAYEIICFRRLLPSRLEFHNTLYNGLNENNPRRYVLTFKDDSAGLLPTSLSNVWALQHHHNIVEPVARLNYPELRVG